MYFHFAALEITAAFPIGNQLPVSDALNPSNVRNIRNFEFFVSSKVSKHLIENDKKKIRNILYVENAKKIFSAKGQRGRSECSKYKV